MSTSWTAGVWKADDAGFIKSGKKLLAIAEPLGKQTVANARLMAAAPKLRYELVKLANAAAHVMEIPDSVKQVLRESKGE